jgi:hypothetical protein
MPDLDTGSDFGSVSWVPGGFAGWGNEGAAAAAAWGAAIDDAFYQNAANSMGGAVSPNGTTFTPDTGIAELPIEVPSWMTQIMPGAVPDFEQVTSWIIPGTTAMLDPLSCSPFWVQS